MFSGILPRYVQLIVVIDAESSARQLHASPILHRKRSVFYVDDEEDDEVSSDDEYDENEPERKKRMRLEEDFTIDFAVSILREMKALDVCVIDCTGKASWVPWMIHVTGVYLGN